MDTITKVKTIENDLNDYFVERKNEIHGLLLGLISGSNVLLIGPPGTAKSMLVSSWAKTLDKSKYFAWQLHQFSTPEELFGPYSLSLLDQDKYVRITEGKMPDADIAFIDEVFKCSHGNLNAMLSILNERVFFNDGKAVPLDLKCVIGASNEVPEDGDHLEAFMDRFTLKYIVDPIVENENFATMLKNSEIFYPKTSVTMEEVRNASQEINRISIDESIVSLIIELRNKLSTKIPGKNKTTLAVNVTDRMFRLATRILKAEAWLNGASSVVEDDLEILQNVLWSDPTDKLKVYSSILEVINPEKDKVMQLYYDSEDLYNKLQTETSTAKTDKDRKAIEPKAFETAQKIRSAKAKIAEHIKDLEKKGRKTSDLEVIQGKVEQMLNDLYEKTLGTTGFKGWE
jgi:MoxR-like ATPase